MPHVANLWWFLVDDVEVEPLEGYLFFLIKDNSSLLEGYIYNSHGKDLYGNMLFHFPTSKGGTNIIHVSLLKLSPCWSYKYWISKVSGR